MRVGPVAHQRIGEGEMLVEVQQKKNTRNKTGHQGDDEILLAGIRETAAGRQSNLLPPGS
jgi:hypothetical protein